MTRAFDVWVHKAIKAGWSVTVEASAADEAGTACGVVEIEGLRYCIHHGRRVRRRVPAGKHVIAAAVDLSAGQLSEVDWGWEFAHAAWAEPILADEAT